MSDPDSLVRRKAIGATVNDETLDPYLDSILKNARRLADDAQLLLDNDRIGTATAIAVLALEECAKYKIIYWKRRKIKVAIDKSLQGHKLTQHVSCAMVNMALLAACMIAVASKRNISYDQIMAATKARCLVVDGKTYRGFPEEMPDDWMNEIQELAMKQTEHKISRMTEFGFLEKVKHIGLYINQNTGIPTINSYEDLQKTLPTILIKMVRDLFVMMDCAGIDAGTRVSFETATMRAELRP